MEWGESIKTKSCSKRSTELTDLKQIKKEESGKIRNEKGDITM